MTITSPKDERFAAAVRSVGARHPGYVLRCRSPRLYYTGRAGDAWTSPDAREAFAYSTYGEAERVALTFNRRASLTGLYFAIVGAEHA